MNISMLSKAAGVSRQSIYSMFGGASVFNTAFEKIAAQLGVSYKEITEEADNKVSILKRFPDKIKKVIVRLSEWAEKNHADLILFGSRSRGKMGISHDFDLGVFFHKKPCDKGLCIMRQNLSENAFPYRIDVINLNSAPDWFKESIEDDMIYLRKEKKSDAEKIKGRA